MNISITPEFPWIPLNLEAQATTDPLAFSVDQYVFPTNGITQYMLVFENLPYFSEPECFEIHPCCSMQKFVPLLL